MALYVNTNVSSINAQRKLTNATNSLNVSYQRLASGLRINSVRVKQKETICVLDFTNLRTQSGLVNRDQLLFSFGKAFFSAA